MALIFFGETKCALCGKTLSAGEEIFGLPTLENRSHYLYNYSDVGYHQSCFNNWDEKEAILKLLEKEKLKFKDSDYYQEMLAKYGKPTNDNDQNK